MRLYRSLLGMALCIASIGFPKTLFCQTQSGSSELSPLPSQADVRSADWTVRRGAFARLIGIEPEKYGLQGLPSAAAVVRHTMEKSPSTREVRTVGLIQLLTMENGVVEEKRLRRVSQGLVDLGEEERLSEAYVNYYGDLIAAVVTLRDVRSLDALVGAITTGNMVSRTLVAFGKQAVAPVARQLQHADSQVRSAAARTLSQMASAGIVTDSSVRSMVKRALLAAANDKDAFVRRDVIDGLVRLGDPECIAAVQTLARTDPFQALFLDGRYLVREAATKALQSRSK